MTLRTSTKLGAGLAGGAAAVVAVSVALGAGSHPTIAGHSVGPTATALVIRTNLSERQQVAGTLGYQPASTLVAQQAASAVTKLPAAGAVVQRGGALYELDGQSVRLLYGAHAAWRTLELGISDGEDVAQLKRNLIALGYASPASLTVDQHFDAATSWAVERWQTAEGTTATGVLTLGSVAFLPGAVRVSALLALAGAPIQPGTPVLGLSSPELTVSIALDPTLRQLVHLGDRVSIQLPAGNRTAGRVTSVAADVSTTTGSGQAQTSAAGPSDQGSSGSGQGGSTGSQPTVAVSVSLLHSMASRGLDQVPVSVEITDTIHRHVLAVPVGALLALAEGGYAVATYQGGVRTLVGVRTGVFDGGRVEVSGRGLRARMRVEVPGS